jgi:hypothetical protein
MYGLRDAESEPFDTDLLIDRSVRHECRWKAPPISTLSYVNFLQRVGHSFREGIHAYRAYWGIWNARRQFRMD